MAERKECVQRRRLTVVLRKLLLQKEKEEHAQKMKEFQEMTSQQSDVFRIAVCGKFKTGKTSLLNLLLGLDLPVMAVTATGVVTKIIYHASMSAEFEDGSRKKISKRELNQYITVAGKDLDGIKYSDAVSVDVPCESPLMMNGRVEFWDTPGLEDDRRLTEITMNAVKKCDMAVLVINAAQLLSQKEKLFLYQMQEMMGGNVLVVINRWDMLREDEKPGVRKTAEMFLEKFGNDLCGYGRYLPTSANPDAPYIDSLMNKLYDICENESVRKEYGDHARNARIDYFVREWDELLGQDIDWLESYLQSRQNAADEEESRRTEELKRDYKEKKEQVKCSLSEIMCKVDERSYWADALKEAKKTIGWETQYVRLSTDIMKKSLQDIYQKAREVTGKHFTAREYPECYPLPVMSEENVWDKMDWGKNFYEEESSFGGVMAGAAAGAVVGSAIPIVGTLTGGILGAVAGIFKEVSKENKSEKECQEFKSSCINKTVAAFYKEPSMNAKREIQNYMDELFSRIEKDLPQKCRKIRDELVERAAADQEYHESAQLLEELLKYRYKIRENEERIAEMDEMSQSILCGAVNNGEEASKERTILFLGGFCVGKSTLINAMLREEVFLTGVLPSSSMVARISYGEDQRVRICCQDGTAYEISSREEWISKMPRDAESFKEALEKGKEAVLYSRNVPQGICMVDTPGDAYGSVTVDRIIPTSDIIVFVMNATQALNDLEKGWIKSILDIGYDKERIWFVFNMMDRLNGANINIRKWVYHSLSFVYEDENGCFDETLCNRRIFFTSARDACDIRMGNKSGMTEEKTGVPALERSLESYMDCGK